MKIQKKITIACFSFSCLIILSLCFSLYLYFGKMIRANLLNDYEAELSHLADTFLQLEKTSKLIGINALNAIDIINKNQGMPSNEELKKLASDLSVSHIYVTNQLGWFIRSTNGPINANIFNYCADYAGLIKGKANIFSTPVVPSSDELIQDNYKYIMKPSYDRKNILEVAINFKFIGELLSSTLKNNKEFMKIEIFTPTGVKLGSVNRMTQNIFDRPIILTKKFYDNSENCCECSLKKVLLKNDRYYYTIVATVSQHTIYSSLRYLLICTLIVSIFSIFICYFISYLLASFLTSRFQRLHHKINTVMNDYLSSDVILEGNDEIADISIHVHQLISKFNASQKLLVEAEKSKALSSVALQLAHDICSPIAVLNIVTHGLLNIEEEKRGIIKSAIQQINDITDNMLSKYVKNSSIKTSNQELEVLNSENISKLLTNIIAEKKIQYSKNSIIFYLLIDENCENKSSLINASTFCRILSNIINNAAEATQLNGVIKISLSQEAEWLKIAIQDNGCGMSADMLSAVMQSTGATFKPNGHGLGIPHAIQHIKSWHGKCEIESEEGKGTLFKIHLPISSV